MPNNNSKINTYTRFSIDRRHYFDRFISPTGFPTRFTRENNEITRNKNMEIGIRDARRVLTVREVIRFVRERFRPVETTAIRNELVKPIVYTVQTYTMMTTNNDNNNNNRRRTRISDFSREQRTAAGGETRYARLPSNGLKTRFEGNGNTFSYSDDDDDDRVSARPSYSCPDDGVRIVTNQTTSTRSKVSGPRFLT